MSNYRVDLRRAEPLDPLKLRGKRLGQILVSQGFLTVQQLSHALEQQRSLTCHLGELLVAEGYVEEENVFWALSLKFDAPFLQYDQNSEKPFQPDWGLADDICSADLCLRHRIVPWGYVAGTALIATANPEAFSQARPYLEAQLGPVKMAILSQSDFEAAIQARFCDHFAAKALRTLPAELSCRSLSSPFSAAKMRFVLLTLLLVLAIAFAPSVMLMCGLFIIGTILLALATLRVTAIAQSFKTRTVQEPRVLPEKLPRLSILVPLYKEANLFPALIDRFANTKYPKALLDLTIILEADDLETQEKLKSLVLPPWMRVCVVSQGAPKTKPRALNAALPLCQGDIIGIYDAEDAPDPDQLFEVVAAFHKGDATLGCVQGVLDYFNPHRNWIARCFTIEYATWFRVILPGISKCGFIVPLGGTSVFIKRDALEHVGAWDPYNVTEDADLGVRLERFGYRTQLISSVTEEEVNYRAWPWIRQRGRWLKGYILTYYRHCWTGQNTRSEVGLKKWLGLHLLFGGTLIEIFGSVFLWMLWPYAFGFGHIDEQFVMIAILYVSIICMFGWVINCAARTLGVLRSDHKKLWYWQAVFFCYTPMAILAGYRAAIEALSKPFFWDKTEHGLDEKKPYGALLWRWAEALPRSSPDAAPEPSPEDRSRVMKASEICVRKAS